MLTSNNPWAFRRLRWRDCEGALVGLRRPSEDEIVALVGSGVHQGKTQVWRRDEGRVWTVPDWLWINLSVGGAMVGQVMGRGFIQGGSVEVDRIRAIADGGTVEPWDDQDVPLIFTGDSTGTSLGERDRSATGRMALMVATLGWWIFPLPPGTKIPFGGSHGYKDALVGAPSYVAEHYARWPDDNIALATGQGTDTPVVIDIDPRNGGSVEQAEELFGCPLAWTLTATSPSGGWHLYFTDPLQDDEAKRLLPVNSGGFPDAPGVEIKARGRHVVMPPSTYGEGAYRFLQDPAKVGPGLLPEEIRTAARSAQHRERAIPREPGREQDFDYGADWILQSVRNSAFNGRGRNNVVHEAAVAMTTHCFTESGYLDALRSLKEVALETALPEHEIDKAIRSAAHTWRPESEAILDTIL